MRNPRRNSRGITRVSTKEDKGFVDISSSVGGTKQKEDEEAKVEEAAPCGKIVGANQKKQERKRKLEYEDMLSRAENLIQKTREIIDRIGKRMDKMSMMMEKMIEYN